MQIARLNYGPVPMTGVCLLLALGSAGIGCNRTTATPQTSKPTAQTVGRQNLKKVEAPQSVAGDFSQQLARVGANVGAREARVVIDRTGIVALASGTKATVETFIATDDQGDSSFSATVLFAEDDGKLVSQETVEDLKPNMPLAEIGERLKKRSTLLTGLTIRDEMSGLVTLVQAGRRLNIECFRSRVFRVDFQAKP